MAQVVVPAPSVFSFQYSTAPCSEVRDRPDQAEYDHNPSVGSFSSYPKVSRLEDNESHCITFPYFTPENGRLPVIWFL